MKEFNMNYNLKDNAFVERVHFSFMLLLKCDSNYIYCCERLYIMSHK